MSGMSERRYGIVLATRDADTGGLIRCDDGQGYPFTVRDDLLGVARMRHRVSFVPSIEATAVYAADIRAEAWDAGMEQDDPAPPAVGAQTRARDRGRPRPRARVPGFGAVRRSAPDACGDQRALS